MYVDRLYPMSTLAYENNMDRINGRINSGSFSESDESRKVIAVEERKHSETKKKHRRGRKRNRPKWKPYAKMTEDERKAWNVYEKSRMAQKERKLAAMSSRPVAPFNTTQFIMEDRTDSCVYQPRPPEMNRCVSFDSSTSGVVANRIKMAHPILSLSPFSPFSETLSPPISNISSNSPLPMSFPLSPLSLIHLGDDSFELEEDSFHEQDAFLEADFNQVYTELRMNRLEAMNKQELVKECFALEDRLSVYQQEKTDLLKQLQELQEQNAPLTEDLPSHNNLS